jgi:tetratricopeptide (TPR) repeat protein
MLYELGKLEEAEAHLRETLTLHLAFNDDARRVALTNEAIGYTLMERGRYKEAIAYFDACTREWPDRGCAHRAVAEAWLRQGDGVQGLSHARRAAEIDRAAKALNAEIHNLNLAEALATLAWAVAESSSDAAQVDRLVEEAVPLCGNRAKPILGQIHYHVGRAYAAVGLAERSTQHLEQAMAVDPRGNFGRLAREFTHSAAR